jgi:hypothetical protein
MGTRGGGYLKEFREMVRHTSVVGIQVGALASVRMDPTTPQEACFEAGIKFGTLYHQFAGTPVSPDSAGSLERAMEEAIENQPYCASVTVDIREDTLREALEARSADYAELTGRFMAVEIAVEYEECEVVASMAMDGDYPLMRVESVDTR